MVFGSSRIAALTHAGYPCTHPERILHERTKYDRSNHPTVVRADLSFNVAQSVARLVGSDRPCRASHEHVYQSHHSRIPSRSEYLPGERRLLPGEQFV